MNYLIALPRSGIYLLTFLYLLWLIFLTWKVIVLYKAKKLFVVELIIYLCFVWLLPIIGPLGIWLTIKKKLAFN